MNYSTPENRDLAQAKIESLLSQYLGHQRKISELASLIEKAQTAQETIAKVLENEVPKTFIVKYGDELYRFQMDIHDGGILSVEKVEDFINVEVTP